MSYMLATALEGAAVVPAPTPQDIENLLAGLGPLLLAISASADGARSSQARHAAVKASRLLLDFAAGP